VINKDFSAVPFTRGPNPYTEDLSVVEVAVRKEQQLFDKRVKEWTNTWLLLRIMMVG
jgi:hypothetical protein